MYKRGRRLGSRATNPRGGKKPAEGGRRVSRSGGGKRPGAVEMETGGGGNKRRVKVNAS